jgi:undecaprenyl diphosphate synthase
MDGNGRWAKQKGAIRILGHQSALSAVRDTVEGAVEYGIKYLTLYAFSTENWSRPAAEVSALMRLLSETLVKERKTLVENQVRLHAIGQIDLLPTNCRRELDQSMALTRDFDQLHLTLALSYGSRADMLQAIQQLATNVAAGKVDPQSINEQLFRQYLSTAYLPDPELLIRTSGEFRISNFLLWEIAYAEVFITPKLWPDFRRQDLHAAILSYQQRERRFGKTSEQISASV